MVTASVVRRCFLLGGILAVLGVGFATSASAHMAPGIRASIVGSISSQPEIQTAYGRIRVTNSRRPTLGSDGIACRLVVHDAAHRNISGGRAIHYWDAVGRVPRGTTRILHFQVIWLYGRVADHVHLLHCHAPMEWNP